MRAKTLEGDLFHAAGSWFRAAPGCFHAAGGWFHAARCWFSAARGWFRAPWLLVVACLASPPGAADTVRPAALDVKATAAVRHDHALVPADRVVPGDEVFYTLEIRNTGAKPLPPPTVDFAIPEHMRYIANSAVGAGAEVSYSVDGGHTFDRPENLSVVAGGGDPRLATAADYTHIRWRLKHVLQAKAMALARFRAIVK